LQKIKLAKQSKHVYVKELKNQSEAKVVNSEANVVIAKNQINEAKRTGSF
jgi:hypothetical protein